MTCCVRWCGGVVWFPIDTTHRCYITNHKAKYTGTGTNIMTRGQEARTYLQDVLCLFANLLLGGLRSLLMVWCVVCFVLVWSRLLCCCGWVSNAIVLCFSVLCCLFWFFVILSCWCLVLSLLSCLCCVVDWATTDCVVIFLYCDGLVIVMCCRLTLTLTTLILTSTLAR